MRSVSCSYLGFICGSNISGARVSLARHIHRGPLPSSLSSQHGWVGTPGGPCIAIGGASGSPDYPVPGKHSNEAPRSAALRTQPRYTAEGTYRRGARASMCGSSSEEQLVEVAKSIILAGQPKIDSLHSGSTCSGSNNQLLTAKQEGYTLEGVGSATAGVPVRHQKKKRLRQNFLKSLNVTQRLSSFEKKRARFAVQSISRTTAIQEARRGG